MQSLKQRGLRSAELRGQNLLSQHLGSPSSPHEGTRWNRAQEVWARQRTGNHTKPALNGPSHESDAPNDVAATRTYYIGSYPQSLPAGAEDAYAFDRCFGTKS